MDFSFIVLLFCFVLFSRALEELKAVDVRLLRRLLASLAWPFTFVASLRQLLLTLTVHALAFLF